MFRGLINRFADAWEFSKQQTAKQFESTKKELRRPKSYKEFDDAGGRLSVANRPRVNPEEPQTPTKYYTAEQQLGRKRMRNNDVDPAQEEIDAASPSTRRPRRELGDRSVHFEGSSGGIPASPSLERLAAQQQPKRVSGSSVGNLGPTAGGSGMLASPGNYLSPWERPIDTAKPHHMFSWGTPQVSPTRRPLDAPQPPALDALGAAHEDSEARSGDLPPSRAMTAAQDDFFKNTKQRSSTLYLTESQSRSRHPTTHQDSFIAKGGEAEDVAGLYAGDNALLQACGISAEEMNQIRKMEEEDRMVKAVYDHVLRTGVRNVVQEEAKSQVKFGWGTVFAVIRNTVKNIVVPLCPRSKGVTKALKTGAAYSLPVELDADDKAKLNSLHIGSSDEVVAKLSGAHEITKRQLLSLEGRSWLSDPVINGYFYLIQQKCEGIVTLSSFFYSKLKIAGYAETCRFTRKTDLFTPKKVLVVINDGSHWTLAVINHKKQRFEYYDSLGGTGTTVLNNLADYMDEEHIKKKGCPAGPKKFKEWDQYSPGRAVPQQSNGYDCGVFCTQFGLYVAQDVGGFTFGQQDMTYMRQLMQLELMAGTLLPRL